MVARLVEAGHIRSAGLGLALIAAAILVRVPFFDVPMISDEGGYSYVALFWSSDYRLYRDIPFDRPPGIFLIYQAIIGTLGSSLWAIRLGAAIWNAATTLALFRFARETSGSDRAAAVAAGLFALVSTAPHIEGFTANAELFTVLPLALAAHSTWRRDWFVAGILAGVATVIKPIGVSGVLLAAFWIWYQKAGWKAFGRLGAGYAVIGALALGHIALIDWAGFWAGAAGKADAIALSFSAVGGSIARTSSVWVGLALVAGLSSRPPARAFGLAWIASGLLGMAIGGAWSAHYWTQLIPPLAWMSTAAFTRRWTRPLFLAAVLGIGLFARDEGLLWFSDARTLSWILTERPGYLYEDAIAAYLRATTQPGDTIQVAFWEAAIYPLAQRRATVPHLYSYEYEGSRRAYDRVVTAIERRQPAAVVWVNPPLGPSPEAFRSVLVSSGYAPSRYYGQIVVYHRLNQGSSTSALR